MTGARGLKIANIDKLYIFDMQLFMFLYRGVFFDAALLGVLHCYIVTCPSGVHFCKCNNVTM